MGLDVSGQMIVGFRVRREEFLEQVGTKRQCVRCYKDRGPEKFCPDDGSHVVEVPVEQPTPGFANYAKLYKNQDPIKLWENMNDSPRDVGFFKINDQQTYEDKDPPIALGIQVLRTRSHRSSSNENIVLSLDVHELQKYIDVLNKAADELGVLRPRPIEIFLCMDLSY